MRVDVVTLFPELFAPFLEVSFVGRARELGILHTRMQSPRDFGLGKHRSVDDTPYGGGSGMVLRVDCLVAALESLDASAADGHRAHRILMTPQGARFDQRKAVALSQLPAITLICGRYEGFDARLNHFIDDEISLGDFVMTGGEVAAMAVIESVIRLLPGVLGNASSTREESHSPDGGGLLEYPQYTRPLSFRGHEVPEVLRGGNHATIAAWRHQQARALTGERRPDLLAAYDLAHPPPPPKKPRRKKKPAAPVTGAPDPADDAGDTLVATRDDPSPPGPLSRGRGGEGADRPDDTLLSERPARREEAEASRAPAPLSPGRGAGGEGYALFSPGRGAVDEGYALFSPGRGAVDEGYAPLSPGRGAGGEGSPAGEPTDEAAVRPGTSREDESAADLVKAEDAQAKEEQPADEEETT